MDQGPIAILRDFERRAREGAAPLPEVDGAPPRWLGARLGDQRVLLPLGEVGEVLKPPPLTRVPGAQPWLKGMAYVRGRLLTVVDLAGFLRGEVTTSGAGARLVALRHRQMALGLMVDAALGLQRFEQTDFVEGPGGLAPWVEPYACGVYDVAETRWALLDLGAILTSPRLRDAAVRGDE
jgi:twitching motility protein PilI